MFAYCNNNPVSYEDSSGYSLWPSTIMINDSTGGAKRSGTTNSNFCEEMEAMTNPSPNELEFGYAETESIPAGSLTSRWLAGNVSLCSVDLVDRSFTFVSLDMSIFSHDVQTEQCTLSLFSMGNLSVSAAIGSSGIEAGAIVSVWAPSVSVQCGKRTVTFSALIGASGIEMIASTKEHKFGVANGFGWSISIS